VINLPYSRDFFLTSFISFCKKSVLKHFELVGFQLCMCLSVGVWLLVAFLASGGDHNTCSCIIRICNSYSKSASTSSSSLSSSFGGGLYDRQEKEDTLFTGSCKRSFSPFLSHSLLLLSQRVLLCLSLSLSLSFSLSVSVFFSFTLVSSLTFLTLSPSFALSPLSLSTQSVSLSFSYILSFLNLSIVGKCIKTCVLKCCEIHPLFINIIFL